MKAKKDRSIRRPFDQVVNELCINQPWNLNAHYEGCFACFLACGSRLSAGAHLAFDAIEGAVHDVELRAGVASGGADPDPRGLVAVPFFFLRVVARCWGKYKADGGSLGRVFALEGGRGKRPATQVMNQVRDERAIARWIGDRITKLRVEGVKAPVTRAIQGAAEKFRMSEDTIRKYWNKFRRLERERLEKGS